MIFAEVPVAEAAGAILAHSLRLGDALSKKGRLLSAADVAALAAARSRSVDRGAARARRCRARTTRPRASRDRAGGRACSVDRRPSPAAPTSMPRRDGVWSSTASGSTGSTVSTRRSPSATLAALRSVEAGQMVATVKIIPFAVPATPISSAASRAAAEGAAARAWRPSGRARVGADPDRAPAASRRACLDKTRRGHRTSGSARSAARRSRTPLRRTTTARAGADDPTARRSGAEHAR